MRRILLFLIALFICYNVNAQRFKSYDEGYYYNTSDQKVSGFISSKYFRDCIYFKPNKDGSFKKIMLKDIKALVTLTGSVKDSVNVLSENNNKTKRYFAHFSLATPYMNFYTRQIAYSVGGTPTMSIGPASASGNGTSISWTTSRSYSGSAEIIMYEDGNTTYKLTKRNYIEVLSKAMADAPDLVQRIRKKEFKFDQVYKIFEHYKFVRQDIPVTIKLDSAG